MPGAVGIKVRLEDVLGNSQLPLARRLAEVVKERAAQDAKWGEQDHTPVEWLAVLTEEVGEVAQAALNVRFRADQPGVPQYKRDEAVVTWGRFYRAELLQVAAVAIAAVESFDRNEGAPDADH